MLSEETQQLFQAAKQAQVTRNEAVHIIMSDGAYNVLHGAFIRVLLELQDHREDYIVARVGAITTGDVYSGFSTNPAIRTDKYLMLALPVSLAVINGTRYQLNSISNSTMTEAEFVHWLEMMPSGHSAGSLSHIMGDAGDPVMSLAKPTCQELIGIAERIRTVVGRARHGHAGNRARRPSQVHAVRAPSVHETPRALSARHHRNSTAPDVGTMFPAYSELAGGDPGFGNGGDGGGGGMARFSRQGTATALNANSNSNIFGGAGGGAQHPPLFRGTVSPRPASAGAGAAPELATPERDYDLPTRRQVRQDVINKMSQRSVLFPLNINELKVSQLRLTERDMIEYLEHVREAVSSKQENCVVCMDHVPTVISLPCRHKVLCRLCASSVNTCPVCRSQLFELFEPKEI
ncbi:hypothetical protein DQ04_10511000 [Trypanosoma grayi]|uniref:hypothetical protein n=1 Tax=Trypanosoma grayi TaxID=71804 RepID=UPI0004F4B28F|nr:hypothetical protein DQ04_10511000 [Trypanosoma grayi]KEG07224.1 hypothetical protein DQ04_10511000 [Trypanosoma grayi]